MPLTARPCPPSLHRILFTLVVGPVLAASLTAQPAWQLPPGGAAVYDRNSEIEFELLDGRNVGVGSEDEALPVLFDGELDLERRRPVRGAHSFYSIAPYCAFDLDLAPGQMVTRRIPALEYFGEIVADITLSKPAPVTGQVSADQGEAEGRRTTQQLVVTLRDDPSADEEGTGRGAPDADLARLLAWYHKSSVEGSLRITRRFDPERGVVERFRAEWDAVVTMHTSEGMLRARMHGTETWTLRQILAGVDPAFVARIDGAIDRAAARLRRELEDEEEDSWHREENPGPVIGPALHAQYLRGLGDAGVPADDPLVALRLDELLKRRMQHPRALLETILALEALHGDTAARREALRAGRSPEPVELPATLRRRLQRLADALVDTYDRRASSRAELHYGHRAGSASSVDWDGRVAEGLVVAAAMGARIKASVWPSLTRAILSRQVAVERCDAVWSTHEGEQRSAEVAGWRSGDYEGAQCDGKATAICVAALLGLRERLSDRDAALRDRLDTAVRHGLGWLAVNFTPRQNPSRLSNDYQWADDYLEFLPRAMERARVRRLGARDWYFETALNLAMSQRPRGGNAGFSIAGTASALQVWLRGGPQDGPVTGHGGGR